MSTIAVVGNAAVSAAKRSAATATSPAVATVVGSVSVSAWSSTLAVIGDRVRGRLDVKGPEQLGALLLGGGKRGKERGRQRERVGELASAGGNLHQKTSSW
jgi:hypothetical protein